MMFADEAVVYSIAGAPAAVFGEEWSKDSKATEMTLDGDLYKWSKTDVELAAVTIQFKVLKNHSWDGAQPSSNFEKKLDKSGKYDITITFNASTNEIVCNAELKEELVVLPKIILHGNFSGDWASTEEFTPAADKKTAALSMKMAKGKYEFGVKEDGIWSASKDINFTRENPAADVKNGDGNMTLDVDVSGTYTFTWTYESKNLAVTYPAADPNPAKFYVTRDSALVVDAGLDKEKAWNPDALKSEKDTFVLNLKAEEYKLKVSLNGTWNEGMSKGYGDLTEKAAGLSADKDNNICFKLNAAGEVQVVLNATDFKVLGDFYVKPVEMKELRLVPGKELWAKDDAKFAVWTWGKELAGEWSEFFAGTGDTLKTKIKATADSIIFVRFNSALTEPKWNTETETDNVWNRIEKDAIDPSLIFTITEMEKGAWGEGGIPTPPPAEIKFYVTGDSALVVDAGLDKEKAWNPDALKSEKDTLVLNLKADQEYALKVTLEGNWETAKGFSDLSEKAKGLATDKDNNIVFKLSKAGEMKVIYFVEAEVVTFKLEGEFDQSGVIDIADGYYLNGSHADWEVGKLKDYAFTVNPDNDKEYTLDITLAEGQKIKPVYVENGSVKTWFPELGGDYEVDADHAGAKTVYFRPEANAEWTMCGGHIFIEATTHGITNTAADVKAVKFFENGQLIIIKNGVKYNAQGAIVK